ncbi:hypothetical protein [Marinomonas gallaica]|uniref:hypothetical protein n=1 Tax=Marinomonas gallaica TaxID=1806667 RepID=UPI003A91D5EC
MLEQAEKVLTVDMLSDILDANDQEREQLKMHIDMPYLSYKECSPERQQAIISEIESELKENEFRVSGSNCNEVWEKGWGEILNRLDAEIDNVENIISPQYFGKYKEIRFQGNYIEPIQKNFEYLLDKVIRKSIFFLYLNENKSIFELGCGTANSLLMLRNMYPESTFTGLDWADASGKIIDRLNTLGYELSFQKFNMLDLSGAESVKLSDGLVFSFHALEQLGSNIERILIYLVQSGAKKFVHVEPIIELYDDSQFDAIAEKYHIKRNYLNSYLKSLEKLEKEGVLKVHKIKRLEFGNRYHEAYSLVIWEII